MRAVGVTGSRFGLSIHQRDAADLMLRGLQLITGAEEFHHGDCVGVDAEVAEIARGLGYRLVAHPPTNPALRAYVPSDVVHQPAEYMTRNRYIVDGIDILLGYPDTRYERQRSGTWATIRYARRMGRHRMVVDPDGRCIDVPGDPALLPAARPPSG